MNMPIFYIGINKGIVGKNKRAFSLIGYLLDDGKQGFCWKAIPRISMFTTKKVTLWRRAVWRKVRPENSISIHAGMGSHGIFFTAALWKFPAVGRLPAQFRAGAAARPVTDACGNHSGYNLPLLRNFFRDIRRKKVLQSKSGPT